jgi:UBX domain-containing protein 1
MGAEEVPEEPIRPDKPYQAVGGYRLGDGSGPSEKIATASTSSNKKQSQVKILKLWKNGFNVDDGPLRLYEDRKNMEFLNSVRSGVTPQELIREAQGGEVQLDMQDHREEEFVPPKSPYVLFNNEGHKLGSPTPKIVTNTPPEAAKKNEENALKLLKVDESQPKTQIRLTLSDGSKVNISANHGHKVSDLRKYLATARPEYNNHKFIFQTSFPKIDLNDENKTLKEENLLNSVLIVKLI